MLNLHLRGKLVKKGKQVRFLSGTLLGARHRLAPFLPSRRSRLHAGRDRDRSVEKASCQISAALLCYDARNSTIAEAKQGVATILR